ncbi:hypothetical protein PQR36_13715 [Paraburkholderia nemoris]|uniref:hypothetical protein n=1 Tax=Paraburkholderia nemoris TaxID=2793076 RepID=UPI0038BA2EA7
MDDNTPAEAAEGNPCLEFFQEQADNKDKVKLLQIHPRLMEFERLTASTLSPGPVENSEDLLRQIFNPLHVELDTGDLKPSAFEDAANKGMSVDRLQYREQEESFEAGYARAEVANANAKPGAPQRTLHGLAKLRAESVRALVSADDSQCFGVYDTALADNKAHADICQILHIQDKKAARSARSKLVDLAKGSVALVADRREDAR